MTKREGAPVEDFGFGISDFFSHSSLDILLEPGMIDVSGSPEFPGAIGFDWMTVSRSGVPWLISWPRKKLIKH